MIYFVHISDKSLFLIIGGVLGGLVIIGIFVVIVVVILKKNQRTFPIQDTTQPRMLTRCWLSFVFNLVNGYIFARRPFNLILYNYTYFLFGKGSPFQLSRSYFGAIAVQLAKVSLSACYRNTCGFCTRIAV